MRRIMLVLAVVVVGSLGVVTAATAAGGRAEQPTGPIGILASPAVVAYAPAEGATGINPTSTATVTVSEGTFDSVTLTNAEGAAVQGVLDADRTSWSSTEPLGYGTSYTWGGSATGADGTAVPLQGSFATLAPANTVRGTLNIGDDRTVGVAAPVRIQFDDHVEDRAAVERALTVTTSVPVEGAWGWLPDEGGGSRVDWRPKEYWPSGTTVTVGAKLYGVAYGAGAYGAADITTTFQIGRSQIVKADVNSHRMIVIRDGQQVATTRPATASGPTRSATRVPGSTS